MAEGNCLVAGVGLYPTVPANSPALRHPSRSLTLDCARGEENPFTAENHYNVCQVHNHDVCRPSRRILISPEHFYLVAIGVVVLLLAVAVAITDSAFALGEQCLE